MRTTTVNKRMLFIIIPFLGLSLIASLLASPKVPVITPGVESIESSAASSANYDVDDQKHEAPANHEPIFMSIFKFLVNSNPFRKDANL